MYRKKYYSSGEFIGSANVTISDIFRSSSFDRIENYNWICCGVSFFIKMSYNQ